MGIVSLSSILPAIAGLSASRYNSVNASVWVIPARLARVWNFALNSVVLSDPCFSLKSSCRLSIPI